MTAALLLAALAPAQLPDDPPPGGPGPAMFAGRAATATKTKLLTEYGGNAASEAAVARGLAWLARQQKADGSWVFDPKTGKTDDRASATGLALLPFLGAGMTHKSAGSRHQKTVADGLKFLVTDLDLKTGKFAHGSPQYLYGHAAATLALCEAFGMTKDRVLLPHANAAVQFIVKSQAADGGWGDTPTTATQLQALHAARLSRDIAIPVQTVDRAMGFLDRVSSGSLKSAYGDRVPDGASGTATTAAGLWCRYHFAGWGPNNVGMAEGVAGQFGRPKKGATGTFSGTDRSRAPKTAAQVKLDAATPDLNRFYYATQVVRNYGGRAWQEWNEGPTDAAGKRQGGMRDWLITTQKTDGVDAGSWNPDAGPVGEHTGRVGSTAVALLILESPYRYLPLYTVPRADD